MKREDIMAYPRLKLVAEWLHGKAANLRQSAIDKYICKIQKKMEKKGGHGLKEVVKRIDNKQALPTAYLERDREGKQGQPKGTITTDPGEIDGIVRRAWMKIYSGTKEDTQAAAKAFIVKYWEQIIYKAEEYKVEDITKEDVKEACREAGKAAGGMDGWDPAGV